jgi:hypothetical protein
MLILKNVLSKILVSIINVSVGCLGCNAILKERTTSTISCEDGMIKKVHIYLHVNMAITDVFRSN